MVQIVCLPRVIVATIAGVGLGILDASLQGMMRNLVVSPDLVGVSSGAASGLTVLFTTHHPHHALAVADDALLMLGGTRNAHGPASDVLNEDNLHAPCGVDLKLITFEHKGEAHQTLVPVFPCHRRLPAPIDYRPLSALKACNGISNNRLSDCFWKRHSPTVTRRIEVEILHRFQTSYFKGFRMREDRPAAPTERRCPCSSHWRQRVFHDASRLSTWQ